MRLIRAGWTSAALEAYAMHRFGEDVPASTFRSFKARLRLDVPETGRFGLGAVPDDLIDVVGLRQEMIALQTERVRIDFTHEQQMGKLFGSNKGEIALLSNLLDQHREDMQALGAFPVAGQVMQVEVSGPSVSDAPRFRSLGDLVPGADEGQKRDLAKVLHLLAPTEEAG